MKLAIKPYLLSLIKENSIYLLLLFILVTLELILFPINSGKISQGTAKINIMKSEVAELNNKISSINSISLSQNDIDSYLKMLNKLIPNSEDYFSIIYALDTLSKETNFTITSFTINLKNSNSDRLKLSITGTGNKDTFLKFLKDYNYRGGRLITSDKIELSQQFSGQMKIDITVYNSKPKINTSGTVTISNNLLQRLRDIDAKIMLSLKESSSEGKVDFNYPRKINPF